jgi:hypothetical protein
MVWQGWTPQLKVEYSYQKSASRITDVLWCELWRQASSVFLSVAVQWQQAATRTVGLQSVRSVYSMPPSAARNAESREQETTMTENTIPGFVC